MSEKAKTPREYWSWLLGKKITDIEPENSSYLPELYAIVLDDGTRISPKKFTDIYSLEVEKP